MNIRILAFTVITGLLVAGCSLQRGASVATVPEECRELLNMKLIGQNGPEVCVTTPLSKTDTSIAGTIVSAGSTGPFMVTAVNSDGGTVKQVSTLANGDFTMSALDLRNLPGKAISFTVMVNGIKSPSTNLVVGQVPPSKCNIDQPGFPRCATHPGAILFPVKSSITAIVAVPSGEYYGGTTIIPQLMALDYISWRPERKIGFFRELPPQLAPGQSIEVYSDNSEGEVFTYPVPTIVLPR
ncbi:hypothetical protein [Pseudomonas sp. PB3P13]